MPRLHLLLVALGAGIADAGAAVAGVPVPPRPGPFPVVTLWSGNDAFGGEIGDNADDYRTNEIALQAVVRQRWVLVVDHSMLTNRTSALAPASRSDEITASAGYLIDRGVGSAAQDRWWFAAGLGGRFAGDFLGAEAQNALHRGLGYNEVDLPEAGHHAAGVVYATAGWLWLERVPLPMPSMSFLERGQFGLHTVATALATTAGEQQVEVGTALTVIGLDGAAWLGPRMRWSLGETLTPAAAAVADREEGLWLDYGAGAGGWFVSGGVNLRDQTTLGAVGWSWARGPGRVDAPRPATMEADIGFRGGFTPGVQFRWQPRWLRDAGALGERAALLADYRFGGVPGVEWGPDAQLAFNQAVLGMDLAWSRPRPGWQVTPFVRGALGLRYEVVRVRGPAPRFPEQNAATGVALGGVGLRVGWGQAIDRDRRVRYGVAVSYDGWLPFDRATARNGSDSEQYLRPGAGPGVALTALVAW